MRFAKFGKWTPAAAGMAVAAAALAAPTITMAEGIGHAEGLTPRPELDANVVRSIKECADVAPSCADLMKGAAGALVFPDVLTVDLIVGGTGDEGALVQDGKITGYYDIGQASAGAQIGIKESTQVYIFRDPSTLAELTDGGKWELSAAADLTVLSASANASGQTGDPLVYVFDSNGLNAGVNVGVLSIWQDNED